VEEIGLLCNLATLLPVKEPTANGIEGWMDPTADLGNWRRDTVISSPLLESNYRRGCKKKLPA